MATTDPFPVERYTDVLERLGDDEPSSRLEAQAVIKAIKVEKGYLDESILQDLNTLRPETLETILQVIEQKRKTEAAYTKRFDT
jgi:hypothetical protein